jgi:hypothetical protein
LELNHSFFFFFFCRVLYACVATCLMVIYYLYYTTAYSLDIVKSGAFHSSEICFMDRHY